VAADRLRDASWEVLPIGAYPAHTHMALDEVLLEQVILGRRPPTMRLWSWIERALVIGSHQSVRNEVDVDAARELGFQVTRRMSGGGTMLCEPDGTITYSLYLPESFVAGISFRKSYAVIDEWAVEAFNGLGVPASYHEINDIISPRGKIAGAAQARRRGFVLHHTTIAHSMDVDLLPGLVYASRVLRGGGAPAVSFPGAVPGGGIDPDGSRARCGPGPGGVEVRHRRLDQPHPVATSA